MKESVGYTVSLNIIITFIVIVIAFLSSALIYFKSNKVSNIITETIEKYEGYNSVAINEITMKLSSLGYNAKKIDCANSVQSSYINNVTCPLVPNSSGRGKNGYCVYLCTESSSNVVTSSGNVITSSGNVASSNKAVNYYYYKIRTNMMLNIPIINNILDIPIFSNTNRLYDFESNLNF